MNEIVKYNNYMNVLKFRGFTTMDLNMLMALCAKARDVGKDEITFTFDELRGLTDYQQTSNQKFVNDIKRMNNKLMQVTCNLETETESIMFVLFPTFVTNYENLTLTVSVNTKFAFVLNELTKNFTRFELEEFVHLESKYAKNLFRILKQFKSTGYVKIGVEEFRQKMDCSESYSNRRLFEKVINPALEELVKIFNNLKCEPVYARKRGKPVIGYEFYFGKEVIEVPKEIEKQKKDPVKKAKKNKFTDVHQREYDYEELEKKLLSRGK